MTYSSEKSPDDTDTDTIKALQTDRNLVARLMVIGTIRKLDTDEMLSHSLGPLALSLANCNGLHVKTTKQSSYTSWKEQ